MSFANAVMIPRLTLSDVLAAEDSALGSTPNLEDDNASTNVSINDNDSDEFSEGGFDERQVKKNLGTRRKINFQEEALHLQKRKIKLMEERLIKKSKANEDEGYMFLMSLLPSLKKLDDIQGRVLGIEFLSNVTRIIRISKNLLPPFNSVPAASHIVPSSSISVCSKSRCSTFSGFRLFNAYIADVLCLKRRFTATSVSGSILNTTKGGVLTVDEE